jgi:heptosyltransferase-1
VKILLVKLSSLGDVVHTLPVVQDIRAARPDAQIDWAVERGFAPLVRRCEGVNRVIECELRRWRHSPLSAQTRQAWRLFKADLQQEAYDAVLDLQGLAKSALLARLARLTPGGKRYALANQTEGSGYEAPTRWVADVAVPIAPRTAAVQRSRELAARALGYTLCPALSYGLKVPPAQSIRAQSATEKIAIGANPKTLAFVHGTSRANKEWPLAHWIELGQRLNRAGYQVVLPHGNARELATGQAIAQALNESQPAAGPPQGGFSPLGGQQGHDSAERGGQGIAAGPPQGGFSPLGGRQGHDSAERGGQGLRNAVVWPRLALDALAQALAHCAGVIGVDSGVSHIAVALDLPHVQIYNFDTAWRTGPETGGRQRSVFASPTPTVEAVWQAWLACAATHSSPGVSAA